MKAVRVDLDLASAGYLKSPTGQLRYIWRLDHLVTHIVASGATLYWAPLDGWAITYLWSRAVVLDPALIEESPCRIRRVIAEEAAHLLVGPSEKRAGRLAGQLMHSASAP